MVLPVTATSQPPTTDALRDESLRKSIARARQSEFYARHLAEHTCSGLADLASLPLTSRQDIQDASPFGMLAVSPERAWHYHESSGTTGKPVSAWCSLAEVRLLAENLCRMVPELAEPTVLLNRLPLFAPAAFIFEHALQSSGGCHIPAGNLSWDVPFTRALGFISRLQVTALACLPFEALLLREIARDQGLELQRVAAPLKVIFCGGAVLPGTLRRIIEKDWDARVVEIFGSNEAMGLGISCVESKLHLCTDLVEVEVLDPTTQKAVPQGRIGVLTVTSLAHEAMPLVRYWTGDLVRMHEHPCACGDPRPTATVLGRLDDVVAFGDQMATSYDMLEAAHETAERIGARMFFIIVRTRGLHVILEAPAGCPITPDDTAHALHEKLLLPVTVEYVRDGDVLDRSALLRSPKVYKPSLVTDWRTQSRKSVTVMEAILEWPHFDRQTLWEIAKRQIRSARRRRRLSRDGNA